MLVEGAAAVVDEDVEAAGEAGGYGFDGVLERCVGLEVDVEGAEGGGGLGDFGAEGGDGGFALGDGAAPDDELVRGVGLVQGLDGFVAEAGVAL